MTSFWKCSHNLTCDSTVIWDFSYFSGCSFVASFCDSPPLPSPKMLDFLSSLPTLMNNTLPRWFYSSPWLFVPLVYKYPQISIYILDFSPLFRFMYLIPSLGILQVSLLYIFSTELLTFSFTQNLNNALPPTFLTPWDSETIQLLKQEV